MSYSSEEAALNDLRSKWGRYESAQLNVAGS